MLLALTSGCPEPDDEAGVDELGDTGESEEADSDDSPSEDDDDSDDGDVNPPPIADDDGPGDGDGDGDSGDGDGDGDPPFDDPDRCWDDTWNGSTLPHVILGNTIGRVDSFLGSCGIDAAPDYQLGFVAPWSGYFAFDTGDSSFDTVVYGHDGECGREELACNDDFIGLDSRIVLELDAGDLITVSVDGTGSFEQGLFALEISEAVLPVCEIEFIPPNLPTIVLGDNSDGDSQLASGCGGEGARERVFEFVAPGPGSYRFDTLGSSFDTVLYALDECDGPPLACNDDAGFDLQSELVVQLAGGQQVLIVVDGLGPDDAGPFLLNVGQL